ncbi:MAG: TonB-dependent receptor, partial [Alphaproteobacteria bacterium]|nr:TonB-dependent receptor [Alphaproteobacteria bacterium]
GNPVNVPVNAGSATSYGFEAAINGQLADFLSIFANVGYVDATFDDTDSDGNPQLFAGNRFRLQPEWTASAGFDFVQPVANWAEAYLNVTWTFRSDIFFDDDNAAVAGLDLSAPDLHLVNLRVGLRELEESWQVEFYVNNLFDENYIIDAGNTGGAFGTPTFIAGPPRFYGFSVKGRF